MFDIGPMDLLVLAVVGILVFGPERLPGVARDAARMIRTVRELLLGTHTQLHDELGPELAALTAGNGLGRALGSDLDLRKALARLLAEDAPEAAALPTAPATAPTVGLAKRLADDRPLPYPRSAA